MATGLRDRLCMLIGDYHHSTVTTALAASKVIVDTGLANVKGGGTNDFFNNTHWALITSLANAGSERLISDYVTGTTTLTVQGANYTSDGAALATYEIHRIQPALKLRAINQACRELFPNRFRRILDRTLISGNWLPNAHFEDWDSTSYPDMYAVTNCTAAATTTAGLFRGGAKSALVTASAADGYMSINSTTYPRLLDLGGQTIDFKAWAYPSVADDVFLTIYYTKPDATTDTKNSTTTTYASKWNLLAIDDYAIPSGINYISFRLRVHTNAATCYFDDARIISSGKNNMVWMPDFAKTDGVIKNIGVQNSNYTDTEDVCDDIGETNVYAPLWNWETINDGTYVYLRLPELFQKRRVELQGLRQLESNLAADTDTISLDDPFVDAVIYQAIVNLYQSLKEPASMDAHSSYNEAIGYYMGKVQEELMRHPQLKPQGKLRFRNG